MVLATVSVKVDATHWDIYTKLYPQKGSKLIRDYINTLINNSETLDETTTPEKLTEMIEHHAINANNERIKIEALKAQLEELKSKQEQELQTRLEEESDIVNDFTLLKQDTNWYHKFSHRFIKSGAKDAGTSELDFYRKEVKS